MNVYTPPPGPFENRSRKKSTAPTILYMVIVYHLQKLPEIRLGNRSKSERRTSKKVVLFFRTESSNREFEFHFLEQVIFNQFQAFEAAFH